MGFLMLRDELRWKNFSYNHPDPSAFHRCQGLVKLFFNSIVYITVQVGARKSGFSASVFSPWPDGDPAIAWKWPTWAHLAVRLFLVVYMIYGFIHELVNYYRVAVDHSAIEHNGTSVTTNETDPFKVGWDTRRPWFVFFTLWTYTVLLLHLLLAAVLSVVFSISAENVDESMLMTYESKDTITPTSSSHSIQEVDSVENPVPGDEDNTKPLAWYFKLSWLLSDIITPCAPIVTLIFFGALYQGGPVGIFDLNIHILNTVFVIIDHLECARPIRLLHVVAPIVFGVSYNVFNFIFWTTDHTQHVLYPGVIDWNHPGQTLLNSAGMALVLMPLVMFLWFVGYRLKLWVYVRVYGM